MIIATKVVFFLFQQKMTKSVTLFDVASTCVFVTTSFNNLMIVQAMTLIIIFYINGSYAKQGKLKTENYFVLLWRNIIMK